MLVNCGKKARKGEHQQKNWQTGNMSNFTHMNVIRFCYFVANSVQSAKDIASPIVSLFLR